MPIMSIYNVKLSLSPRPTRLCWFYCQAQPQLQLSWAELVLFPTSPADDDDGDDDDTPNSTF